MRQRANVLAVVSLIVLIFLSGRATAQTFTGRILGRIVDVQQLQSLALP